MALNCRVRYEGKIFTKEDFIKYLAKNKDEFIRKVLNNSESEYNDFLLRLQSTDIYENIINIDDIVDKDSLDDLDFFIENESEENTIAVGSNIRDSKNALRPEDSNSLQEKFETLEEQIQHILEETSTKPSVHERLRFPTNNVLSTALNTKWEEPLDEPLKRGDQIHFVAARLLDGQISLLALKRTTSDRDSYRIVGVMPKEQMSIDDEGYITLHTNDKKLNDSVKDFNISRLGKLNFSLNTRDAKDIITLDPIFFDDMYIGSRIVSVADKFSLRFAEDYTTTRQTQSVNLLKTITDRIYNSVYNKKIRMSNHPYTLNNKREKQYLTKDEIVSIMLDDFSIRIFTGAEIQKMTSERDEMGFIKPGVPYLVLNKIPQNNIRITANDYKFRSYYIPLNRHRLDNKAHKEYLKPLMHFFESMDEINKILEEHLVPLSEKGSRVFLEDGTYEGFHHYADVIKGDLQTKRKNKTLNKIGIAEVNYFLQTIYDNYKNDSNNFEFELPATELEKKFGGGAMSFYNGGFKLSLGSQKGKRFIKHLKRLIELTSQEKNSAAVSRFALVEGEFLAKDSIELVFDKSIGDPLHDEKYIKELVDKGFTQSTKNPHLYYKIVKATEDQTLEEVLKSEYPMFNFIVSSNDVVDGLTNTKIIPMHYKYLSHNDRLSFMEKNYFSSKNYGYDFNITKVRGQKDPGPAQVVLNEIVKSHMTAVTRRSKEGRALTDMGFPVRTIFQGNKRAVTAPKLFTISQDAFMTSGKDQIFDLEDLKNLFQFNDRGVQEMSEPINGHKVNLYLPIPLKRKEHSITIGTDYYYLQPLNFTGGDNNNSRTLNTNVGSGLKTSQLFKTNFSGMNTTNISFIKEVDPNDYQQMDSTKEPENPNEDVESTSVTQIDENTETAEIFDRTTEENEKVPEQEEEEVVLSEEAMEMMQLLFDSLGNKDYELSFFGIRTFEEFVNLFGPAIYEDTDFEKLYTAMQSGLDSFNDELNRQYEERGKEFSTVYKSQVDRTIQLQKAKRIDLKEAFAIVKKIIPNKTYKQFKKDFVILDEASWFREGLSKDSWGYFKNGVVYLRSQDGQTIPDVVLRHEIGHLIFDNYLTNEERSRLEQEFFYLNPGLHTENEQRRKVLVDEWFADVLMGQPLETKRSFSTWLKQLIQRIKNFFNFVSTNIETIDDLVEGYRTGVLGLRDISIEAKVSKFIKNSLKTKQIIKIC